MNEGSVIRKKVSFALRLIDDYDLQPVSSGVDIIINKELYRSIKKSGGYYIFTNLEEDDCEINIESEIYFKEKIEIDVSSLDPLNPLINIRLKKKPEYFSAQGATIVRFKLIDEGNKPIVGALVEAFIDTKNYYEGELSEACKKSEELVSIKKFYSEIQPGDTFYLNAGSGDNGEFVKVVNKKDDTKFVLNKPLLFDHSKGGKLIKAFISKTDEKGNGLIYFRGLLKKDIDIKINLSYFKSFKEVSTKVREGTLLNLKNITL
ncbi:hypothetical protein R9X47_10885 [Wukongibacter baidiensis]|uniref:hypothetical protein n=1 Tax=Wukongibacter baidiensis TaxID=1723361 RepID=UPI003D7FD101